jgi:pyruvate kinase
VMRARRAIAERGAAVPLIAKLEKPQAIDNLEAILQVADGVMVARGDLGVEVAPEKVPLIQKHIIRRALDYRRPVITATQMLESMIENPRPTRAEANDVANAVLDGTDAVMLSGETAVGKYPRETVAMMSRIVVEAEKDTSLRLVPEHEAGERLSIPETICEAVAHAAQDLDMRAIVAFTDSGNTARMLSKYRPVVRIYAFTPNEAVCNRMTLLWGVTPVCCAKDLTVLRMGEIAEAELTRREVLSEGNVFGMIAGETQSAGATNFLRLMRAGSGRTPSG